MIWKLVRMGDSVHQYQASPQSWGCFFMLIKGLISRSIFVQVYLLHWCMAHPTPARWHESVTIYSVSPVALLFHMVGWSPGMSGRFKMTLLSCLSAGCCCCCWLLDSCCGLQAGSWAGAGLTGPSILLRETLSCICRASSPQGRREWKDKMAGAGTITHLHICDYPDSFLFPSGLSDDNYKVQGGLNYNLSLIVVGGDDRAQR